MANLPPGQADIHQTNAPFIDQVSLLDYHYMDVDSMDVVTPPQKPKLVRQNATINANDLPNAYKKGELPTFPGISRSPAVFGKGQIPGQRDNMVCSDDESDGDNASDPDAERDPYDSDSKEDSKSSVQDKSVGEGQEKSESYSFSDEGDSGGSSASIDSDSSSRTAGQSYSSHYANEHSSNSSI